MPGQHTHTAHHTRNYGATASQTYHPEEPRISRRTSLSFFPRLSASARFVCYLTCAVLLVLAVNHFGETIHFSREVFRSTLHLFVTILSDLRWIALYVARAFALGIVLLSAAVFAGVALSFVGCAVAMGCLALFEAGVTIGETLRGTGAAVRRSVGGALGRRKRAVDGHAAPSLV